MTRQKFRAYDSKGTVKWIHGLEKAKEYKEMGYPVEVFEGERFKEEKVGELKYTDSKNIVINRD